MKAMKWFRSVLVYTLVFSLMGGGSLSLILDADARSRGGSSFSRSSSSRSFSKSPSRSFKGGSIWKSKGKKSRSVSKPKVRKTKTASKKIASKKGFGGTSVFDKKASKQIKVAKANTAKTKMKADRAKFKSKTVSKDGKSKKPVDAYTAKTLPKSVKSNALYSKSKVRSTDNYSTYSARKSNYYSSYGWAPSPWAYGGMPYYGAYDSLTMYMMLSTMSTNASMSSMAYNHSNTAEFKAWKKDAEALSKDNAELKAQLAAMDAKLDGMTGTKDPTYLPEGMDATVLLSAAALGAKEGDKVKFTMYTGTKGLNYERFGGLVRNKTKETIAVDVKNSAGTMANIKAYIEGKCDGFVAQGDGIDVYSRLDPELVKKLNAKAVTLYKEPVQMIANKKGPKSVKKFNKNTVLYVGGKGGGTETTWINLKAQNPKKYGKVKVRYMDYSDPKAALDALSDNKNAVIMLVSGLKSGLLKAAEARAKKDGFKLVEVNDGDFVDALDSDGQPLYTSVEIPSKAYPNLQAGWMMGNDVKTVAVDALFITDQKWIDKNGTEAFQDLTAGVVAAQPIMANIVNGALE